MAAKATNETPATVLPKLKAATASLRANLLREWTVMDGRDTTYYTLFGIHAMLRRWRDFYNAHRGTSGLEQYAKSFAAENDSAYELLTEYDDILQQAEAMMGFINANALTHVEIQTAENSDGKLIVISVFPPTNNKIVTLRTAMLALINSIE